MLETVGLPSRGGAPTHQGQEGRSSGAELEVTFYEGSVLPYAWPAARSGPFESTRPQPVRPAKSPQEA
jgi:hypothetical protein